MPFPGHAGAGATIVRSYSPRKQATIKHSDLAPPTILQVDGLSFAYPQRPLFADWSARVPAGITLLRGGDGSGKTTLLRLLAGDLPAAAGTLRIKQVHLGEQPDLYRRQVWRAGAQSEDVEQMTMDGYFASEQRRHARFDAQALPFLLDGLGLAPHRHKQIFMLSTGSKRKVWLAAAFASGAALTLLDQPFAALDRASIDFVMVLLADAAKQSSRAWIVAHFEALGGVPLARSIDLGD